MSALMIILILAGAFICGLINSAIGMLYGTILSPCLIIVGFDPVVVVPSILLSQAVGGITAAVGHHRLQNVEFRIKEDVIKRLTELGYIETFRKSTSKDLKVVFVVTSFGVLATIAAALIAVSIPKAVLKTYIGILTLAMGIILLLRSKFNFSWKKILAVGILGAFNKGISGGGFGPVVTSGQLISGRESKRSIGATALSEAPICMVGFLTYMIISEFKAWNLATILIGGAIGGAIVGPYITAKFKYEEKVRIGLGTIVILLAALTLIKVWLI